jgi:hypothetical protein
MSNSIWPERSRFRDGAKPWRINLRTKSFSFNLFCQRPEKALKLIVVAVDLTGVGLVLWRLIG